MNRRTILKCITAGLLAVGLATLNLQAGPPPVPPQPDCDDFMTGGGWIPVPGIDCNNKGSFGFVGGLKNGRKFGNLNYNDHCGGQHVKGTDLIAYCFSDKGPTCRRLVWNGTMDGMPVTVLVEACDNGEPGRDDTFEITVFAGTTVGEPLNCDGPFGTGIVIYSAGAGTTLGGDEPGGGNIQLHTRCN